MSDFIEHKAPLIIHFNFKRDIENFNSDIKYRNLFEVQKSGGLLSYEKRFEWESHLFGKLSKELKPH